MDNNLAEDIYKLTLAFLLHEYDLWFTDEMSGAFKDIPTFELARKAYKEYLLKSISQTELIICLMRAEQLFRVHPLNRGHVEVISLNLQDWPKLEAEPFNSVKAMDQKLIFATLKKLFKQKIKSQIESYALAYTECLQKEVKNTLYKNIFTSIYPADIFLEKFNLPESTLAGDSTTDAPPPLKKKKDK